MTDRELKKWNQEAEDRIIKALECCQKEMGCGQGCPYYNGKKGTCKGANGLFEKQTLNLINRQKAEIEQLAKDKENLAYSFANAVGQKITVKAEAYKEFAEKVKEEITEALKNNYKVRAEKEQAIPIYTENELLNYCTGKIDCLRGLDDFLDNLLKEKVGDTQ